LVDLLIERWHLASFMLLSQHI